MAVKPYCAAAAVWLLVSLFSAVESASVTPGPTVDTDSGRVVGLYTATAQVFRSIPYARPPVGELRWKDPLPPFPVPGIISATEDPPGCPQDCHLPLSQYSCPTRFSEDCLYLNIFTPLNASKTSNLPVLIYIHGGNYIRGYGGGRLYDGQYIVNTTNIILVTINYRIGALGFLVYGEEGVDNPQGNLGIRDQRLAFKWVKNNIENFGGDSNQITIWGQSAGASSVSVHLASIRSSDLFNQAIIESNPLGITLKNMKDARKLGKVFAEELGCKDWECIQKQNVDDIVTAQETCLSKVIDRRHLIELFMQWTPVVDFIDLADQPMYLMADGRVPSIPVLMGSTSEETVFYIYEAYTSPMSKLQAEELELVMFPYAYKEVHKFYPNIEGDQRPNAAVIGTDFTFTCTNRYAMKGMANKLPLWIYDFNHSASFDGWGKRYEFCNGHSCHGIDLPFLFHDINLGNFTPTAQEETLSETMVQYWGNFAKRGDPNDIGVNPSVPYWPKYATSDTTGTKQSKCMRFKTPSSEVISDYRGDACRFWDEIGYEI